MSSTRGIVAAGVLALAATGVHAGYRSWPAIHGTEIAMAADLIRLPVEMPLVEVRLPIARIALDVPRPTPPATETQPMTDTFTRVSTSGGWWIASGEPGANARKLRGRSLIFQLSPAGPLWPGGPVEMRASTVSDSIVAGATNLAGTVTSVHDDGYVWVDFAFAPIAVSGDVAARARPMSVPEERRPAPLPAADPDVAAVLRVLPSGRAILVDVVIKPAAAKR